MFTRSVYTCKTKALVTKRLIRLYPNLSDLIRVKLPLPFLFCSGLSGLGIQQLDSGQKPAGMTGIWTFARGSNCLFLILLIL